MNIFGKTEIEVKMIKIIKKGIELHKAEKLMKKINDAIEKKLSIHWKCYIKKEIAVIALGIEYNSYENWMEEDLVYILKLINATCTKHSLSMYFHDCKYRLRIEVDIC